MATFTIGDNQIPTAGELPAVGSAAPAFQLTGADLATISSSDLAGKRVVLNIFPSLDTGVCATSVRRFNEIAAGLENTVVLNVSGDLPFAARRFCGAEGIENAKTGSIFRESTFGDDYGVTLLEGGLRGLLARSVVVVDADGTVLHSQLVPSIGEEPDYDAAVAALG